MLLVFFLFHLHLNFSCSQFFVTVMDLKKSIRSLHHCQLIVITRDDLKIKKNYCKKKLPVHPRLWQICGKYLVPYN